MSGQVTIAGSNGLQAWFHSQWVMKAPTGAWPRMRFCGAHPVTSIPRLSLPPVVTFSRRPPSGGTPPPARRSCWLACRRCGTRTRRCCSRWRRWLAWLNQPTGLTGLPFPAQKARRRSSWPTEGDVSDFFSFSGEIEHVEIVRSGDYASTAYVTFREARALETACLLTGSMIADQVVCIDRWGTTSMEMTTGIRIVTLILILPKYGILGQNFHANELCITPGKAVTITQEVVKAMIAMGYVLSTDALNRARAFDETLGLSAAAAAKIAELGIRVGLTDKITAGVETFRSMDEQLHLSETATTVVTATGQIAAATGHIAVATGRTAAAVGSSIVNSRCFAAGALIVSDALLKASKYAADLGHRAGKN
ncbi:unnamed protein product [Spirodela intermedia]|uniref:Uncharacterized protein n=1 Tax=Spirodela intermedia TaxID=51605 RepID=A0A7I8ILM6_SPIIN|nr:unnamed protein product [Spirodela intermedia]CAA6658777.1 unnamed protein product [Spirodela intermedia]